MSPTPKTTRYSSQAIAADASRHHYAKWMMMVLLGLVLVSSVSACGKRGEPYRPSEVPASSSTS